MVETPEEWMEFPRADMHWGERTNGSEAVCYTA